MKSIPAIVPGPNEQQCPHLQDGPAEVQAEATAYAEALKRSMDKHTDKKDLCDSVHHDAERSTRLPRAVADRLLIEAWERLLAHDELPL